jgi:hypothetical protein
MLKNKFNITGAVLSYGYNHYPIEPANLCRFPASLSLETLNKDLPAVMAGISKLSGGFTLPLERITVQGDGIMLEGNGWRVQYGMPELAECYFPHNIVNDYLSKTAQTA